MSPHSFFASNWAVKFIKVYSSYFIIYVCDTLCVLSTLCFINRFVGSLKLSEQRLAKVASNFFGAEFSQFWAKPPSEVRLRTAFLGREANGVCEKPFKVCAMW